MRAFLVSKVIQAVFAIFLFATMIFFLTRITGDPVALMAAEQYRADRAGIERRLGLDRPIYEQFIAYMRDLVRGDLGTSFRYSVPVSQLFWDRFPNSVALLVPSFAVAIIVAIPLGVVASVRRKRFTGRLSGVVAVMGIATPNFWLGLMLMLIFSAYLGWLPSARMGGPSHYVLPVLTLATSILAGIMRLVRSSMLESMGSEYIKLARTKGLSERRIVWHHGLRNSLLPAVSFTGTYAAMIVTGTVVVETIFAWPGTGRLMYEAVVQRDFPVVQGVIIMQGVLIVFISLVTDIIYAWLDPRIR